MWFIRKIKREEESEEYKTYNSVEELFAESEKWGNIWYNKYLYLPFLWYFFNPIRNFPKNFKWFLQRRTRGFDDNEVWDLKIALKNFLAKRLEVWLKKGVNSFEKDSTYEEWKDILKELLWWSRDSFNEEDKLSDRLFDKKISEKEYTGRYKQWEKRVKRAEGYLGKYVNDLWD